MNEFPVRVLVAESGPSEGSVGLRIFSTATGRCEEVYVVSRSTSLLEALQKYRPEVALLQMTLLQPDPAVTVSQLHGYLPDVALILWVGAADKEIAAKCIQAGAKDCLLEGFMDERTLHQVLRTAMMAQPAARALEYVPQSDASDTKRPVYAAGGHLGERPGLKRYTVKMCMEIGNFRTVREQNGQLAAEELLQKIAQALRKSVRASDEVAWNAAGEFVITLQDSVASSLPLVRGRIAARLLPFQEPCGLGAALTFCMEGEARSENVSTGSCEFREAVALPETTEPSTLAGS
jgi:PleD family two-component response regulator